MAQLIFHEDKINCLEDIVSLCPFHAIEIKEGHLTTNAGCKMCSVCVKRAPKGAIELQKDAEKQVDKSAYKGILVFADQTNGVVHPVTYELLNKANQLKKDCVQPVYALLLGHNVAHCAEDLLHYGADKVYVYDQEELKDFLIDIYTDVFEDAVKYILPSSILVGATPVGRQLAPRLAARIHTGLTADCTVLKMKENTDLVQIRPAFSGNIMAQIITPNHRPQMATVRYKVMDAPCYKENIVRNIEQRSLPHIKSKISLLNTEEKPLAKSIETADVLVVAGRGVKKQQDLDMLQTLADLLHGRLACTRPLQEKGFMDAKDQVGLSGRTVRPKLIITCGVSGAIQFVAGMDHSETIVAIDKDENAPIFKTAHIGLVGDLYEIVPLLIEKIKEREGAL